MQNETMPDRTDIAGAPPTVAINSLVEEAGGDALSELRTVEAEAALLDVSLITESQLDEMSIDGLRAVAFALGVPDRSKIIERHELIDAIRQRL
jgi:hypothetical protein